MLKYVERSRATYVSSFF